jgi:NhaP-type Na+/H+ or K+/H+ antiporter
VIIPLFLIDWVASPSIPWTSIPKFFVLIVVGAFVGVIGFAVGKKILKYSREQHEETIALLIVLLVYVVAENLLGSGILAVAVCSLLLTSSSIPQKKELGEFNKELAFLFTLLVFGFLGAEFSFSDLIASRTEIITVVIALFVARLISSFVVLHKSDLSLKEKTQIGLIAPRGVAPAAVAPLLLGLNFIGAKIAVKIVFYAVILSIFFSLIVLKASVEKEAEKEKSIIQKLKEKKIKEKTQSQSLF